MPADTVINDPAVRVATLSVDGLVADAPDGTHLLDGISFAIGAGSMLAVAGPTGAGKTSLAGAISGAIPLTAGSVVVGGVDVSHLEPSRRGVGYVPQADALHGELTVRRTLEYAAELRLAGTAEERAARVGSVIDEIRLHAQAESVVAALSVGQRKRVSIAVELLNRPEVIVLDEPTAGLDPGHEATVMRTLRALADAGHCVVVVTHSQQVIADCDQVAVIATGGGLAYTGPTSRLHSHFATTTPAALFDLLDRGIERAFIPAPGEAIEPTYGSRPRRPSVSAWRQLWTLTRRNAAVTFADRRRSTLFVAQSVVLGALLLAFVTPGGLRRPRHDFGMTTPLSATGMAVLLVTCVTWLGMSNSIREIVKERRILARERRAGLSAAAYVGSKLAVLGPLVALQAAAVAAIAVGRQQVPGTGAVLPSGALELVVGMGLAAVCAVTTGLFVSAVVRSADKALAVLPMVVVVEFVLSGLSPSVGIPGLSQVRDLAASRWAVQAIGATVSGDSHDWWQAVGALAGLSALAISGAFIAVYRSLRTPTVRRARRTRESKPSTLTPRLETLRLVRVGVACLAAVAVAVTGARIAMPGTSSGSTPTLSAAASTPSDHEAGGHLLSALVADNLPGVIGNVLWTLRAGTRLGVDVTAAAYVASAKTSRG